MNPKTLKKSGIETKKVLAKGVDSLYLYLDKGLNFEELFSYGDMTDFDRELNLNDLWFVRTKAHMRVYPVSLRIGAFTFYLNRASAYIQVSSLGFEMRGLAGCSFWLCNILDQLAGEELPWMEYLLVSRIDVYTDFIYESDFNPKQFKTKLRAKGTVESGDDWESKTYYFGNRSLFCVRLYVKSSEIETSGKTYLRAAWRENGYENQRVWRLEFEFRKRKLQELTERTFIHVDEDLLNTLWSYGIDKIQYVDGEASHNNLYRKDLHPIWQELHEALFSEYAIRSPEVRKANLSYRWKIARRALVSYYGLEAESYQQVPEEIRRKFNIDPESFANAHREWKWVDSEL